MKFRWRFFFVFLLCGQTLSAQQKQDRAFWVETLCRISRPLLQSMAEGERHSAMPLEKGPGYQGDAAAVSHLEAVGRCLAGLAPWLALPNDNSAESPLRSQCRQWAVQGLIHMADSTDADYIRFDAGLQPIVDAAFLAHAFLRAPDALWKPLPAATKASLVRSFQGLRNRSAWYSNWLLFAGITEGFLYSIGEAHDPARIDFALHKMKEWYVGDGWYSDGEDFAMDYYNSFVIQPMLVDLLGVLRQQKASFNADYELAIKRMQRHAEFQERLVAPDGSFPVFGRSMTYRSGAFQVLAQTALMHQLPPALEPAQVRAALTAVYHRLYDGKQNFDKNGWLVLGFNGAQPAMADTYTSTGSLYLATLGFLPLGLPADDPFWSGAARPWSSQKIWSGQPVKKDYKVNY